MRFSNEMKSESKQETKKKKTESKNNQVKCTVQIPSFQKTKIDFSFFFLFNLI